MKRVVVLPALITVANGYCGLLSIYKTFDGKYHYAAGLILLAMVFDVLDGMAARLARVTSAFGAQLDSLSDAISFGVAPAFLAKAVVEQTWPGAYSPKVLAILTALFAVGALLRLARYNVEQALGEGSDKKREPVRHFAGIPTPGAAGVVAAVVFLAYDAGALLNYSDLIFALPLVCFGLGALMVSRVTYVHVGGLFLQGRRDFGYLFILAVVLALVTRFPEECAAVGFLAYALSGPVMSILRRRPPKSGGPGSPPFGPEDKIDIPEGV